MFARRAADLQSESTRTASDAARLRHVHIHHPVTGTHAGGAVVSGVIALSESVVKRERAQPRCAISRRARRRVLRARSSAPRLYLSGNMPRRDAAAKRGGAPPAQRFRRLQRRVIQTKKTYGQQHASEASRGRQEQARTLPRRRHASAPLKICTTHFTDATPPTLHRPRCLPPDVFFAIICRFAAVA
jgi:hypothetical protein